MNITFTTKPTSAEEGQPNPIRWCILSGTPETEFKNETSWMKCKDFFNDYAVAYMGGPKVAIYGFNTAVLNIPEKGQPVYIALEGLVKEFENNLSRFNYWLNQKSSPLPIIQSIQTDKYLVLKFPKYYFTNTYNISLVSLIIRLCNSPISFNSFEELIKYKEFPSKEQEKWNKVVAANRFFNLPKELEKYTWYCGPACNSEKPPKSYSLASLIHNNGVLSWTTYMKDFV